MEVLTEEESAMVMETMFPSFNCRPVEGFDLSRLPNAGQEALLIHGPGQKYKLEEKYDIPTPTTEREILVKVRKSLGFEQNI
jgi:hypothetical protein